MRLGWVGGCGNRQTLPGSVYVEWECLNRACRYRLLEFRHYCRVIAIFEIYLTTVGVEWRDGDVSAVNAALWWQKGEFSWICLNLIVAYRSESATMSVRCWIQQVVWSFCIVLYWRLSPSSAEKLLVRNAAGEQFWINWKGVREFDSCQRKQLTKSRGGTSGKNLVREN